MADTPYEPPAVTDYGSLTDLTANNAITDAEDGIGKVLNTDGSSPMI